MTLSPLLCSEKQLTLDVSIVQNDKTRYGGLFLIDNRWRIALFKTFRKATFDGALIREGDKILKSILYRQKANYYPN